MRHTLVKYRPGLRPPRRILAELKRRYPDVTLMWEPHRKRWVVVQIRTGERPWVIRVLEQPDGSFAHPTMVNTIAMLRRSHWSLFQDRYQRERMLTAIDAVQQRALAEARKRDADRRAEGAERIRRLFSPKLVIAR